MIFVTVGTHREQFNRLIHTVDEMAGAKKIREEMFIQTGNSSYTPKNCRYKKFLSFNEFNEIIEKSSLIITHGGAGSIINALKAGKKIIVVPRLKEYGEHTNDHQIDLAEALEKEGKVIACTELKELEKAIDKARNFIPKTGKKTRIIDALKDFFGE